MTFKQIVHTSFAPSRAQRGFTLIEIMVVVVILATLAAIIVPKVVDKPNKARVVKAKQDIRAIESALNMYKLDNYVYPSTQQGLKALVKEPTAAPKPPHWSGYLPRVPVDPWGHPYHYLNPGTHGDIDIYTLGADNRKGGKDADADIGNWSLNQ